ACVRDQRLNQAFKPVRSDYRVIVQEKQILPLCQSRSLVTGAWEALIGIEPAAANPLRAEFIAKLLAILGRAIGRAVIDKDKFERLPRVGQNTGHRGFGEVNLIATGNDD